MDQIPLEAMNLYSLQTSVILNMVEYLRVVHLMEQVSKNDRKTQYLHEVS